MKKCLNCGAEFQDDSLSFCDCGGPLVKIHQASESDDSVNQQKGVTSLNNEVEAFIDSLDETADKIGEDDPLKPEEEDDEIEETYGEILKVTLEELQGHETDGRKIVRSGREEEENTDDTEVEPDIGMTDKPLEEGDIKSILKDLFGEEVKTEKAQSNSFQTPGVDSEEEPATENYPQVPEKSHGISDTPEIGEEERIKTTYSPKPITSGIRLILYRLKNVVAEHELSYDEILIGRSRTGVDVDINLRDVDDEKLTSRRHAKIFRENGAYYIQRLSQKAPVWVRGKFLELGESVQLYDGDRIVLSNSIGLVVRNIN